MHTARAPGSTGGTRSTSATAIVGPAGVRPRCPVASDQNSSSGAITVTCAPSADSAATSTGPPSWRMPTILMAGLLLSSVAPQERKRAVERVAGGVGGAEHVLRGAPVSADHLRFSYSLATAS